MSLSDLPLQCEYRSDESNTIEQFYTPCLKNSTQYWRAVGYFTSQGLTLASKGILALVRSGGKMRLVASPILEPEDVAAIQKGYEARESVLERALLRRFDLDLRKGYSDLVDQRLGCLAWLIAEGRLEVKIALPVGINLLEGPPLYHEKLGIFMDDHGHAVAFTGSANETIGGLVSNFESIDVFWSWDDPQQRVAKKVDNFQRLWQNNTSRLVVYPFPEAVKERLLALKPAGLPDHDPEEHPTTNPITLVAAAAFVPDIPPTLQLRSYQVDAVAAWLEAGGRGLLVMATGTGKTITSLTGAVRLFQQIGRLYVVVSAPYQHLVDQWADQVRHFGFQPILAYQSRSTWESDLSRRTMEYRLGIRQVVCVITTHTTLTSETFQKVIARVKGNALFWPTRLTIWGRPVVKPHCRSTSTSV